MYRYYEHSMYVSHIRIMGILQEQQSHYSAVFCFVFVSFFVGFFFLFCFGLVFFPIPQDLVVLPRLGDVFMSQNPREGCVSFFRTVLGLCMLLLL